MKLRWFSRRGRIVLAPLIGATVTLVVSAQAPQQAPAAQKPPTFQSGTQIVEVDVRVFDRSGKFVTDLKPDDFEVEEDTAAQSIVNLTLIGGAPAGFAAPVPESPGAAATPSSPAAAPSPTAPATGTWLFVFDTPHLSLAGLHNTQKAAEDFLKDKFHEGDLGGIVFDGAMVNNRLTTDRAELVAAVSGLRPSAQSGNFEQFMQREWPRIGDEHEAWSIADQNDGDTLKLATARACNDSPSECQGYADPSMPVKAKARLVLDQANVRSDLSLRVIDGLCKGLAKMAGPKTIVYFSEGFFVTGQESVLRDVTGLASRAGAHFYTVDARGLNHGFASSTILTEVQPMNPGGMPPQFEWNEDSINALAVDTGGIPIRNENNFGRALEQIQVDAGTYYVLGYTPTNPNFDGKYRKIDVKVRRPGVKVRARRGYLALDPAKLLKPVAITPPPPPPAPVAPALATAAPAVPPAPVAAAPASASPEPAPEATAAAVRVRIDKGGFVVALRGDESASENDPATLGWAAYQKGDVEGAERELAKAAADPSSHPWVHYVLGLCHLALNEYPAAAQSWEQVRTSTPTFEPVYFNLADAYQLQRDRKSALSVLEAAAERWPKDPEVFDATGVIQIRGGALTDALASFERATKLAPKDPVGLFNLASAHHAAALRLLNLSKYITEKVLAGAEDRKLAKLSRGAGLLDKALWQRSAAIKEYRRVIAIKGDYVDEARKGLAALEIK